MAFVVGRGCVGCKYTDCVVVCPCECFHEGDEMLYINAEECIDCAACVAECPVSAIFHEDEIPEDQKDFVTLNATMALCTPSIVERKQPLK